MVAHLTNLHIEETPGNSLHGKLPVGKSDLIICLIWEDTRFMSQTNFWARDPEIYKNEDRRFT